MAAPDLHEPILLDGVSFAPIGAENLAALHRAAETDGTSLWAAYGPFLLSYAESRARTVLVGEYDNHLTVLVRRRVRGQNHLDLIVPPFGANSVGALERIGPVLSEFNGEDLETRLLWADLPVTLASGWEPTPYEREYLYRRNDVLAMSGSGYRMLRKRLNRCERENVLDVRDYSPADHDRCADLLREWQDAREDFVAPVFDLGYTMAALGLANEIDAPDLVGCVAEIGGAVRGFAFGGTMRSGFGQFFLLKADPSVVGLSETLRVELIRRLDGCDLVNDAGDLGREGLAQHKRMFRPVAFVPTWKMVFRPTA